MNSQSTIQVFVYGTLKPGESNYKIYCQGKTIAEIPAYTRGQLYHLALGYPGMSLGNYKVQGYLLSFANEDILSYLDQLESYSPTRNPDFNDYNRQQVAVYNLTDQSLGKAWCYLMNPSKIKQFQGKLLPTGIWNSLV